VEALQLISLCFSFGESVPMGDGHCKYNVRRRQYELSAIIFYQANKVSTPREKVSPEDGVLKF
jgi:hypothetical protein